MMRKISLVAALCCMASPVVADINFNGFASVYGGVVTDSDVELHGYDDKFGVKNGSLAALQFSSDLGDGLTATAQILARGEDDFKPEMEWAFLGYEFNDTWRVNVGRIRIPLFAYSDYLDVGYAYHWGAVPPLTYDSVPVTSFDGFNLMANYSMGAVDFVGNVYSNGDQFWGMNWQASYGDMTARIIYAINKATVPIPPAEAIASLLESPAFGLPEAADDVRTKDDNHSFAGVALSYDPGQWFVSGEYTFSEWDPSSIPNTDTWYLTGGWRVSDFTIHATYSVKESTPNLDAVGHIPSDLYLGPPPNAPTLDQTVEGFLNAFSVKQNEIIVGVRYDFHPSAALKFDVTQHEDKLNPDNDGMLLKVGVDVVF